MINKLVELIKTLYNLLKLNRDLNTEIMKKASSQREPEKLSDTSQRTTVYKNQTRYIRYQVWRIIQSIKAGNIKKALNILTMLIKRSRSYKDLFIRKNRKSEWRSKLTKCNKMINAILSKLETAALVIIVFILANARQIESPILEAESTNYLWYMAGIIVVGIVLSVCIGKKYYSIEETPLISVTGPFTQQQYESLQETLANQALIDNLAISPIGDLWILPF